MNKKIYILTIASIFILSYFLFNKLVYLSIPFLFLVFVFNKKSKFLVPYISILYFTLFYVYFELGNLFFKQPEFISLVCFLFLNAYLYITKFIKNNLLVYFINIFVVYFFISNKLLPVYFIVLINLSFLLFVYIVLLLKNKDKKSFKLSSEHSISNYSFIIIYLVSLFSPLFFIYNSFLIYYYYIFIFLLYLTFIKLEQTKISNYFKILFFLLFIPIILINTATLFFLPIFLFLNFIDFNTEKNYAKIIKAYTLLIPKIALTKSYFNFIDFLYNTFKRYYTIFLSYKHKYIFIIIIAAIIVLKFLYTRNTQ